MSENKNYNLVSELLSNILVISSDNQIVYKGEKIEVLLNKSEILNENENVFNSDFWIHLLTILAKIREDKESVTFNHNNNEFLIFPSSFPENNSIIVANKQKVKQINQMELDLKERVKELECLYNISKEFSINENIEIAASNCVNHLINGLQFPNIASVVLELENKIYTGGCTSGTVQNSLIQNILKNGKNRGSVEMRYHEDLIFLEEEQKLLIEVCGKISRALDKEKRKNAIERREKVLKSKNDTLLDLSRQCAQSREKLRTFFSAIYDTIVVIDKDYNIIMSNKEQIGDSGKCYKKLFNADEKCISCPSKKTFNNSEVNNVEVLYDNKSFKLESYPIFDENNSVKQVLEVCRDATKEKQMEFHLIQNYKLASLGKLVAGVAHEINNPNTFILGNLKIIKEAFEDIIPILDEYHENNPETKIARLNYNIFRDNITILIQDMQNGAIRMKKIVEGLRNFAKKDEGSNNENINLNSIISANLRVVTNQIRRNAKVETDLQSDIPVFKGSINKIEQVLLNMVINASQAIENGVGLIKIKTSYNAKSNRISLIISDNGKGMDNKTIKSIFDPFFTTKRDKGGTGLGLSITYGIIKDMNGVIEVDSTLGKGTSFTIHLPVTK